MPLKFFQKQNVYAIFNDQSFNDALTNGIVCFEQMGPVFYKKKKKKEKNMFRLHIRIASTSKMRADNISFYKKY